MLRNILITFGWLIPIVAITLTVTMIYSDVLFRADGGKYSQDLWISVTRNLCQGIQSVALSPLCFFGAYMLEKQGKVSE
jgi:hypothetical protein